MTLNKCPQHLGTLLRTEDSSQTSGLLSNTLTRLLFMGHNEMSQALCLLYTVKKSGNTIISISLMRDKLNKKDLLCKINSKGEKEQVERARDSR